MAHVGAGLENGGHCTLNGAIYVCGWDSNQVQFCVSSLETMERELLDGTNYLLKVCDYTPGAGEDPPRSTITVADDGHIEVVVDQAGNLATYRCRSYTEGFVAA